MNGGPDANCSAQCEKLPYCGDGIRDAPDEECDCGMNADWQPAGCYAPNSDTDSDSECDSRCELVYGGQMPDEDGGCNLFFNDHCYNDSWGAEIICHDNLGWPICSRVCESSLDCYWNNRCEHAAPEPFCLVQLCGGPDYPGRLSDWCVIEGIAGSTGWCMPAYRLEYEGTFYNYGHCMESGDSSDVLAYGEPCLEHYLGQRDRSVPACGLGTCMEVTEDSTRVCVALCDWEAAYAVHILGADPDDEKLPCPPETNCFSTSEIHPSTGIRGADFSYCEADYLNGLRTCDLLSDELLRKDTGETTCADLGPGMGCVLQHDGTLVGACEPLDPDLTVWADCGPGGTCPAGTECVPVDVFNDGWGIERCVPYCDTSRHATGQDCLDLGAQPTAGATPVCTSLSQLYVTYSWEVIDGGYGSPSRLGYCALPLE